jgi:hypothetical protein
VLSRAAEHGLPCPGIEAVLAMIVELEEGLRTRCRLNVEELDRLLVHSGGNSSWHVMS